MFSTYVTRRQTRKANRKEARKLKKMRVHAFKQGKPLPTAESLKQEKLAQVKKLKEKKRKKQLKQRKKLQEKKKHDVAADHNALLLEDNKKDERLLRQLEKSLKVKKRKSSSLPQAFVNDGLDFLLDVIDPAKRPKLDESTEPGDIWHDDQDTDGGVLEMGKGGSDVTAKNSQSRKVKSLRDDDDDDDDSDGEYEEDAKSDSENESADDDDDDDDDNDDASDTDYNKPHTEKTRATNVAVTSPAESRKRRLQELEGFVKSKSPSKVKGILKGTTPSSTSSTKLVKFAADDEKTSDDDDLDTPPVYREDIYGRMRDEHGNVISRDEVGVASRQAGAYVPPGKRQKLAEESGSHGIDESTDESKQRVEVLTRQVKGQINRLSEGNLASIAKTMESMYSVNARAELTSALTCVILDATLLPTRAPPRVITDIAMLLAVLHSRVGCEVTASFLHQLVDMYQRVSADMVTGKQADNALLLLAQLYNFKVISCQLMFDVIKSLVTRFSERDIDLLHHIMKEVGFSLRKDDPATLRQLLVDVHSKSASVDVSAFTDPSRVKFLLEALTAIKNNNVHKLLDVDQQQQLIRLQKLLKTYTRGKSDTALNVGLDDLLRADSHGKWYLVGSAGHGNGPTKSETADSGDGLLSGDTEDVAMTGEAVVSEKIVQLGRKLGMNTDLRRAVFYSIITSDDYVDAFDKLLHLTSKQSRSQREAVHIVFKLCLGERTFNEFYARLLDKLCAHHRQLQMTVQFCVQDHLKLVAELTELKLNHLADLIEHLLATSSLSLTVFKNIDFAELERPMKCLLERVLRRLISNRSQNIVEKTFQRIASSAHLQLLRDGLRLFLLHFLKRKSQPNVDDVANDDEFRQRLKLAENILMSAAS